MLVSVLGVVETCKHVFLLQIALCGCWSYLSLVVVSLSLSFLVVLCSSFVCLMLLIFVFGIVYVFCLIVFDLVSQFWGVCTFQVLWLRSSLFGFFSVFAHLEVCGCGGGVEGSRRGRGGVEEVVGGCVMVV